jgi:quinol monooxygenase YgiN
MFHENRSSEGELEAHFQTAHRRRWLALIDGLCAGPLDVTRWQRVG